MPNNREPIGYSETQLDVQCTDFPSSQRIYKICTYPAPRVVAQICELHSETCRITVRVFVGDELIGKVHQDSGKIFYEVERCGKDEVTQIGNFFEAELSIISHYEGRDPKTMEPLKPCPEPKTLEAKDSGDSSLPE